MRTGAESTKIHPIYADILKVSVTNPMCLETFQKWTDRNSNWYNSWKEKMTHEGKEYVVPSFVACIYENIKNEIPLSDFYEKMFPTSTAYFFLAAVPKAFISPIIVLDERSPESIQMQCVFIFYQKNSSDLLASSLFLLGIMTHLNIIESMDRIKLENIIVKNFSPNKLVLDRCLTKIDKHISTYYGKNEKQAKQVKMTVTSYINALLKRMEIMSEEWDSVILNEKILFISFNETHPAEIIAAHLYDYFFGTSSNPIIVELITKEERAEMAILLTNMVDYASSLESIYATRFTRKILAYYFITQFIKQDPADDNFYENLKLLIAADCTKAPNIVDLMLISRNRFWTEEECQNIKKHALAGTLSDYFKMAFQAEKKQMAAANAERSIQSRVAQGENYDTLVRLYYSDSDVQTVFRHFLNCHHLSSGLINDATGELINDLDWYGDNRFYVTGACNSQPTNGINEIEKKLTDAVSHVRFHEYKDQPILLLIPIRIEKKTHWNVRKYEITRNGYRLIENYEPLNKHQKERELTRCGDWSAAYILHESIKHGAISCDAIQDILKQQKLREIDWLFTHPVGGSGQTRNQANCDALRRVTLGVLGGDSGYVPPYRGVHLVDDEEKSYSPYANLSKGRR